MTVQPSPAAATPESSTPVARLRPLSLRIRALAENPARGVMRLGLGLIALQLAVRLVMALRGWFVGDDYAFIARAWEHPSPDLDLLSLAYAGHVMPLGWLWIWVCTHLAPYNFMVPTLMSTLVQALTGVVVLRLLIALFGRRWAVLVPFTLYLFSTISVPAYVWWAAAINQQPQALAMAGVLLNHVQYLRTGRARRAAAAVACLVGGLGFSERTILVLGVVAALTVAYFTAGRWRQRLWEALRRHWGLWGAYAAVAGAYLAYYALAVTTPIAAERPTVPAVTTLFANQFFQALVPAALGGPWQWEPLGVNAALAAPPRLAVEVGTLTVIALLGLLVALHHRAWFALAILAGYHLVLGTLLAFSRAAIVGPGIGREYRYLTEMALVGVVCLSLAALPVEPEAERAQPQPLVRRPGAWAWIRRALPRSEVLPLPSPRVVIAVATALISASSLYSSWRYTDIFSPSAGRTLLTTLRAEAPALPKDAYVSDTPVDEAAVWTFIYPYSLPSRLLPPAGLDLPYLDVGQVAPRLLVIDASGSFRDAAVEGPAVPPGPEVNCGYRIGSRPSTLSLADKTVVPWKWLIRIGYLSSGSGTTTVHAGDTTTTMTVERGVGTRYLLVSGVVKDITFGGFDGSTEICTNDVTVGTAVPLPAAGSTP